MTATHIVPALKCALKHYIAAMRASLVTAGRAPTTRSDLLSALRDLGWEDETLLAQALPELEAAFGLPYTATPELLGDREIAALSIASHGMLLRLGNDRWMCQNAPEQLIDDATVVLLTRLGHLAEASRDVRFITLSGTRTLSQRAPRPIPPIVAAAIADLHRRAAL